jgi:hypothetical protein
MIFMYTKVDISYVPDILTSRDKVICILVVADYGEIHAKHFYELLCGRRGVALPLPTRPHKILQTLLKRLPPLGNHRIQVPHFIGVLI